MLQDEDAEQEDMEGEYDEEGEEDEDEDEGDEGQEEEFDGLEDMPGQLDPDDVVFVSAPSACTSCLYQLRATHHRPAKPRCI